MTKTKSWYAACYILLIAAMAIGPIAAARAAGRDLRTVDDGTVPIRLLTLPIGPASSPVGWLQTGFVLTLHDRQTGSLILAVTLVGLVGLAGADRLRNQPVMPHDILRLAG